jgi:outer membrane protein insertion porin family
MTEKYFPTPEKNLIPGPTFQAGYGAGLEWMSPVGPLELALCFPGVRHAGKQYRKFQFQIGPSH